MVLFGAGGHGKVILSILESQQLSVSDIIDDDSNIDNLLGYPVIHSNDYDFDSKNQIIISIGNNLTRRNKSVDLCDSSFGLAVHRSAVISIHTVIQPGTVIMPQSIVHPSSNVGKHCIINSGSIVEHDCYIGDFVHVAPNATVCGEAHIGEGSIIGAGAIILPGIKVGKWCQIGAGAVVIKDVSDGCLVVGNPAKVIRTYEI